MLRKLTSSKIIYPSIIAASAFAFFATTQSFSKNMVNNETATKNHAFKGDGEWVDLKIAKIENVSHDTKKFTFALPNATDVSGLVTASAILAKYVTPKGSNVIRPYTPVSDISTKGEIELVIKKYDTGKFSPYVHSLGINDTVSFKGPILKWKWEPSSFEEITLIGAGSGITPLYQMAHHIAQNPDDKTKVKLFYGNKTFQDILMKEELDTLVKKYPGKIEVTYFLDDMSGSSNDDKLVKGFITKEHLIANGSKPGENTQVFVCGPPPFMNAYSGPKISPSDQGELVGILSELGFTKEHVFKF